MLCFLAAAIVGAVWLIVWQFMVYDTPNTHPRISHQEQNYIEISVKHNMENEHKEVTTKISYN